MAPSYWRGELTSRVLMAVVSVTSDGFQRDASMHTDLRRVVYRTFFQKTTNRVEL